MTLIHLKIKRQDKPESPSYFENFQIMAESGATIISALQIIRKNPRNISGKVVAPVVWESLCHKNLCGSCTLIINGKVRQACQVLLKDCTQPIVIEPLKKFPVIRDLVVDRYFLRQAQEKMTAWNDLDAMITNLELEQKNQIDSEQALTLAGCHSCGACLESCPQINTNSSFLGPAVIAAQQFYLTSTLGQKQKSRFLSALMEEGGIAGCSNAQNCVRHCPKELPLTTVLAKISRETNHFALKKIFG